LLDMKTKCWRCVFLARNDGMLWCMVYMFVCECVCVCVHILFPLKSFEF
jgi:hypothetical protein